MGGWNSLVPMLAAERDCARLRTQPWSRFRKLKANHEDRKEQINVNRDAKAWLKFVCCDLLRTAKSHSRTVRTRRGRVVAPPMMIAAAVGKRLSSVDVLRMVKSILSFSWTVESLYCIVLKKPSNLGPVTLAYPRAYARRGGLRELTFSPAPLFAFMVPSRPVKDTTVALCSKPKGLVSPKDLRSAKKSNHREMIAR